MKEIFKDCTVEGNIIKLPSYQLDRKDYLAVKKVMENNYGKWKGGKVFGFLFDNDPKELLTKLQGGEIVNNKKETQFFATPIEVVEKMIKVSGISAGAVHQGKLSILEPSAGDGAIVNELRKQIGGNLDIDVCEIDKHRQNKLEENEHNNLIVPNFLDLPFTRKYDWIFMNPPFNKGQFHAHILKAYKHLNPEGTLVSIMPRSMKESEILRDFVKNDLGEKCHWNEIIELPKGSFKSSNTQIDCDIIFIQKK
jgi:type I restriction-modification system DNA methylase subunit